MWFPYMINLTCYTYSWFIYIQMWFLYMIHLTCDSYAQFVYWQIWFLYMIHLFSHLILTHDSVTYRCDSYTILLFTNAILYDSFIFQFFLRNLFIFPFDFYTFFPRLLLIHNYSNSICCTHIPIAHNSFIFTCDFLMWVILFHTWFHIVQFQGTVLNALSHMIAYYSHNHVKCMWFFPKGTDELSAVAVMAQIYRDKQQGHG